MRKVLCLCAGLGVLPFGVIAQPFTHADTLRGSIGPERAWWDVGYYDVTVRPDPATKSIQGSTTIAFKATAAGQRMQIDLQQPLVLDSVVTEVPTYRDAGFVFPIQRIPATHDGNVVWVDLPAAMKPGEANTITIVYHGVPREAKHAPWDGGWIWSKNEHGDPWMSVACQGLGASAWYPCKDHQSDEPDDGAALHITVADGLSAVGNGRSRGITQNADGTSTWHWVVTEPINSYNLVPYIGKYVHWSDTLDGAAGKLSLDYWVLADHEAKGRAQFEQVKPMVRCFEDWFGPYPFYTDGYKLVEAPHLGMEHQSAIAYGNQFKSGYLGRDLSGTGHGLEWDFIIVHESGHEWFGNSITTADIADMWVHEGFTNYSETIFTQCQQGEEAGNAYQVGTRKNIKNDKPIIGPYGVNQEGSGDMYYKAASMIHMIRQVVGDSVFKAMLLEMNKRYFHRTVTSAEIEGFISTFTGHDFRRVFQQYLLTTRVPELQWYQRNGDTWMRWNNCVQDFDLPFRTDPGHGGRNGPAWFHPTESWTNLKGKKDLSLDPAWYATIRKLSKKEVKQMFDKRRKRPYIGP